MPLTREKIRREKSTGPEGYDFGERIFQLGLILFILYMAYLALKVSSTRFFDFDEYQVLYESASLVRGKALYSDRIGIHFPFMNVTNAFLMSFLGFKTATVLAVRYFVFLFFFITLLFIFKITEMHRTRTTGLIAVALTISCMVFLHKGIEIRHDVFNMAFNTMGAYWALEYLKQKKTYSLWLSGLSLGLAIASTQKAAIWSAGIMIGLLFCTAKEGDFRNLAKVLAICATTTLLPLILFFGYLHFTSGESLETFLEVTIVGSLSYLSPEKANRIFPFPYTKTAIYKGLLYENGLFYLLSLCGLFWALKGWFQRKPAKVIITSWAAVGILFYLTTSRPFHQSLLPTIPAMGILAACFAMDIRKRFRFFSKRIGLGVGVLALISLLVWPLYLIVHEQKINPGIMNREMQNISFCLDNLKADEKVLSFTRQHVFFESLMGMGRGECGSSIYTINAACFEEKMIEDQCKVIIFDHRTRYLNKEVQKRIEDNYLHAGVGDILIPGFKIPPGEVMRKRIWIKGDYYSSMRSLEVDGEKRSSELVHLDQGEHTFRNTSNLPTYLVYVFHPKKSLDQKEM
jgi:hypothetical protein